MEALFPEIQGKEEVFSDYYSFLFMLSLYANYNDEGVRKSVYTLIESFCQEEIAKPYYSSQSSQSIWNPIVLLFMNAVSQEHSHVMQQYALRALLAIRKCYQSDRERRMEMKEEKSVCKQQSVSSSTTCCHCHQECINDWLSIEYLVCPCNTQTAPLIDIRNIQDVVINPNPSWSARLDNHYLHQEDDKKEIAMNPKFFTEKGNEHEHEHEHEHERGWAFWRQDLIDLDMVDVCCAILSSILSNHKPLLFSPLGKQRWLMRLLLSNQEYQQAFLYGQWKIEKTEVVQVNEKEPTWSTLMYDELRELRELEGENEHIKQFILKDSLFQSEFSALKHACHTYISLYPTLTPNDLLTLSEEQFLLPVIEAKQKTKSSDGRNNEELEKE